MDIFSLGCVIFELLQTLQPSKGKTIHIESLFNSKVDSIIENFNLSTESNIHHLNNSKEHIQNIIKMLGTPRKEDLKFITNDTLREYIESLPYVSPFDFRRKFSYLKGEKAELCLDLLIQCLQFNPSKRITAYEAINHPFFSDIRNINSEITFDKKLTLNNDNWRKYNNLTDHELTDHFIRIIIDNYL